MLISSLLAADRIYSDIEISSKKRLLEYIAETSAEVLPLSKSDIFNKLLERERLGTTGLGKGFAVPHARLTDIEQAYTAFFKLKQPINYDAPDQQAVDLIFVLFIPEASTDEHLQILASIAKIFSQPDIPEQIRQCHSALDIIGIIAQAESEN